MRGNAAGEIAIGNGLRKIHRVVQRAGNGSHNEPASQAGCRDAKKRNQDQQETIGAEITFHLLARTLHFMVLDRNQRLHFRFIGLLQVQGVGHHFVYRARTVVILHGLQNAVARVKILLAHAVDIGQHLLGFFILESVVQLAQDCGDALADRLQTLL